MRKLIIEYKPMLGDFVQDALVQQYVNGLIYSFAEEQHLYPEVLHRDVGSELIITGIRVAIKQGKLNQNEVIFRFNGHNITADSRGRLSDWPNGFCNIWDSYLDKLLDIDENQS